MVDLKPDGEIIHQGKQVGYLGWTDNLIVDVFVEKPYRNQGIATEAVSQMESMVPDSYDIIRVNTVLSSEMESVLKNNGFENRVVEKNTMDISDIPDIDRPPTEEEVIWFKRC